MIAWMMYAALVSVLVAIGARAAEWVGRSARYPARWVWAGAMLFALVLAGVAPYRDAQLGLSMPVTVRETAPVVARVDAPSWTARALVLLDDVRGSLNAPLQTIAQAVGRRLPAHSTVYMLGAWSLASAALLLLFVIVQLRFRRARRDWPVAHMHGSRVRVAPNVGPVVIGVVRPEIVVPHWLLARRAHEQQLVVAHEAEHVRARDTMLLGAACFAVAVMPWNPAIWYMLSRLRLAVELDCDARVLRAGAAPLSYGALLIDVAEHNSGGWRLPAPALTDDSSHLRQRIMAMKTGTPKFALLRGSMIGAFALVSLLAACEAKMPTAADIDKMDAASAERAAVRLAMLKESDSTVYVVNGEQMPAARARAISRDSILSIDVRGGNGGPGQIRISTKEKRVGQEVLLKDTAVTGQALMKFRKMTGDTVVFRSNQTGAEQAKAPLIYIDGVRSSEAAMRALGREAIASVEIVKGAAAASYANDPQAANGVIFIKTKKAGGTK